MNHLLFLECSPVGSESLGAQQVLAALADCESFSHGIHVTTRSLAMEPLAALSAQYAQAVTSSAPSDDPVLARSERLIGELEACDGLLISTPMHNFAVPATLKLWIDHVLRKERSFTITPEGKAGLLRDRPALVLVRSGNPCVGETARQPDFLTPYLRHALSVMGIHNVQFVYLPGFPLSAEILAQTRHALTAFLVPSRPTGDLP
ncbi:FMN-dependent NADH-azoreductase [Paraburkholderia hayleyella]|uniref:FMN-dependent NADH-azoreductase n=1 Tax=Paraburkholderia hayleyella TaxID=2152889 RepID=UPI00157FDDDA|nr:NAD(P)H-dependent oxidoreductase [Paraburkholderia hayleyella]